MEASKEFYVGSLGLVVSHEDEDRICLRAMEERGHHSMVLSKSNETTVKLLGFKVFDDADLDKLNNFFREEDLPTEWVDRPFQGRTLRARDPFGVPIEFFAEMNRLPAIHQRYDLYKGVKPLRIDHANMFSPDVDKSVAVLHTTRISADRIYGGRGDRTMLGRLDAPQGERPRHRHDQRTRSASPPFSILGLHAAEHY